MAHNSFMGSVSSCIACFMLAGSMAFLGIALEVPDESVDNGKPYVLPLRRESVPVRRQGKVVSFKNSYSGIIHVGGPKPQEFRVVFDTGSGHVILPAIECESESCLLHRRYNMRESLTAVATNVDGSEVFPGELCDRATIGFGTGRITGEFVHELVCLGPAPNSELAKTDGNESTGPCVDMQIVLAVEMSSQPFRSFNFDGILGMGLSSLALTSNFSLFHLLNHTNQASSARFGVFLTEGEDDEESEISIGGHNPHRMLGPLAWVPVKQPELGYWQVEVLGIRVDGRLLDMCREGCQGIVDTGSSHVGVPTKHHSELADLLTAPSGDLLDCRLVQSPMVEIELPGVNITLHPENYMRRLPLREGVTVASRKGVVVPPPRDASAFSLTQSSVMATSSDRSASSPKLNTTGRSMTSQGQEQDATDVTGPEQSDVTRHCKPRVMAVSLPPPLGQNLVILGEPVLHRYYTVYDWKSVRIGFGLAKNRRNMQGGIRTASPADRRGTLPKEVDHLLVQTSVTTEQATRTGEDCPQSGYEDCSETAFMQLSVVIVVEQWSSLIR